MTSSIDPIRRAAQARRAYRSRAGETESSRDSDDRHLPVVQAAEPVRPTPDQTGDSAAAFSAHMLGQEGARRGLRGGPETLGAARNAYGVTEWSGKADRRARKGSATRTEV